MVAGRIELGMSRQKSTPIGVPRTTRMQDVRVLTSLPAGRVVPIFAAGLLREDGIGRCQMRLSFEMMETVEVLLNAVNVDVKAYFVSNLASPRFDGMDALNRSYSKIAVEGLPVVPFFDVKQATAVFGEAELNKYMGLHAGEGDSWNAAYWEAYNLIWNFRARNRSPDLAQRLMNDGTLAPAFWKHQHFRHIVPSFDQAVIDGEVPLNVTGGALPVRGITMAGTGISSSQKGYGVVPEFDIEVGTVGNVSVGSASPAGNGIMVDVQSNAAIANANRPQIFAEMAENGITVSLSNIELARKTQAFARLKEQYKGIEDPYIVDLLMQGIRVPEQALQNPILIGEASTIFGMSKRYSTDSTDLTASVVNGATFVDLAFRLPPVGTGGVVMVTAEITPEQLFERQRDPYLFLTDTALAPDYLRDTLDPEKVDVVLNSQVDAYHTVPAGTFGYEPLHAKWIVQQPRIGGRFYRNDPSDVTNDEDRNRIWAVETIDPTLSADFYICTNIHTKPFVVQNQDPFEVVARGMCVITGNTVFGGALVESTGSYDEIMAEAPLDRIDQPPVVKQKPAPKPAPKKAAEAAPKALPKPKESA